jgi:hypothetical protein
MCLIGALRLAKIQFSAPTQVSQQALSQRFLTFQAGGVTTPPETHTEQRVDRLVLKKDRLDESYTRPIRIYAT